MPPAIGQRQLTIGELAAETGVATSTLRYWEELGVLPPAARVSGQRRYAASAVMLVGEILLLQEAGFTLRELKTYIGSRHSGGDDWRALAERKLVELDEQIARATAARTAIAHGLKCPHRSVDDCPNHAAVVTARLAGSPLSEAHAHR